MNCAKLYNSKAFKSIEKIKCNISLTSEEIQEVDDFFSQKENQIFLNSILANNIEFNFELLQKTIMSTFKNNFKYFKNICKKGVCPTIYAGYKNKSIVEDNKYFIEINNETKPFLWIDKKDIKDVIANLPNTTFNFNLYYYLDSIINVNELKKLKSYSNLVLVGKNEYSYIDLKHFSKEIIDLKEFEKFLK